MRNLPLIIVGALLLAGLGGILLLSGGGGAERRLNGSVIGVGALEPWLEQQGLPVETSNPRIRPDIAQLSLRILPLYDTDLSAVAPRPESPHAAFYATTMRELDAYDVSNRLYELPALVVLPKWVAGTVVSDIAHKSALIPLRDLDALTQDLNIGGLRVLRKQSGFFTADLPQGKLALFEAQVFDASRLPDICRAEVALPQGVLIAACRLQDNSHTTWVLSDPDLLNNHGLTLAENARILATLLQGWTAPATASAADLPTSTKNRKGQPPMQDTAPSDTAQPQRIYIDLSGENLVTWYDYADEAQDYDRSSEDFARFFLPPFAGLWAMLLIVLGVAFWRGSLRFGPVSPAAAETPEQSKSAAIATNARLLRIAGHDGRMAAEFVQASLSDLAIATFGRAAGAGPAGQARLFTHLARRDAAAAGKLQALAGRLTDASTDLPPPELRRSLETYRSLLERLTHV